MKLDLNEIQTLSKLLAKFNEASDKKVVTENELAQGYYKLGAVSFLNFILKEQDNEQS